MWNKSFRRWTQQQLILWHMLISSGFCVWKAIGFVVLLDEMYTIQSFRQTIFRSVENNEKKTPTEKIKWDQCLFLFKRFHLKEAYANSFAIWHHRQEWIVHFAWNFDWNVLFRTFSSMISHFTTLEHSKQFDPVSAMAI